MQKQRVPQEHTDRHLFRQKILLKQLSPIHT